MRGFHPILNPRATLSQPCRPHHGPHYHAPTPNSSNTRSAIPPATSAMMDGTCYRPWNFMPQLRIGHGTPIPDIPLPSSPTNLLRLPSTHRPPSSRAHALSLPAYAFCPPCPTTLQLPHCLPSPRTIPLYLAHLGCWKTIHGVMLKPTLIGEQQWKDYFPLHLHPPHPYQPGGKHNLPSSINRLSRLPLGLHLHGDHSRPPSPPGSRTPIAPSATIPEK